VKNSQYSSMNFCLKKQRILFTTTNIVKNGGRAETNISFALLS
jgi:hypothetical protein